jgi:transcriptional regulator with XRE-family HTH domain
MKKYSSLGELIVDYRELNQLSQADLASKFDLDVRTVLRWERNETLLKPEKEEQMAAITFIPHQVIRNLNSPNAILTYYDFEIRKYSLSLVSNELPEANWIKEKIDVVSDKIRPIESDDDIDNIIRYTLLQKDSLKTINKSLIKEAAKRFSELNLIVTDELGNYAGHSLYFPLHIAAYNKIKEQKIMENDLTIHDLVSYKTQTPPVFYCHSITADCNDNFFFIIGAVLKFYRDHFLDKDYIYALITSRYDSYNMSDDLGINLIWEDFIQQEKLNLKAPPRLLEGNFTAFLKQ